MLSPPPPLDALRKFHHLLEVLAHLETRERSFEVVDFGLDHGRVDVCEVRWLLASHCAKRIRTLVVLRVFSQFGLLLQGRLAHRSCAKNHREGADRLFDLGNCLALENLDEILLLDRERFKHVLALLLKHDLYNFLDFGISSSFEFFNLVELG